MILADNLNHNITCDPVPQEQKQSSDERSSCPGIQVVNRSHAVAVELATNGEPHRIKAQNWNIRVCQGVFGSLTERLPYKRLIREKSWGHTSKHQDRSWSFGTAGALLSVAHD